MATIVAGGTGYTGSNIVREAASRGHQVISVSWSEPKERVEGVRYEVGAAEVGPRRVIPGARGCREPGALRRHGRPAVEVYRELARLSAEAGARYPQVGGFSCCGPPRRRPLR